MPRNSRPEKKVVERAARMYSTATGAAAALGVTQGVFTKWCRLYEVLTPKERRE